MAVYHPIAIQLCIAKKKYKQKILTIYTKQFYSCLSEIKASSLVCFAFLLWYFFFFPKYYTVSK